MDLVRKLLIVACWMAVAAVVSWLVGGFALAWAFAGPLALGFGVSLLAVNWMMSGKEEGR